MCDNENVVESDILLEEFAESMRAIRIALLPVIQAAAKMGESMIAQWEAWYDGLPDDVREIIDSYADEEDG